MHRYRVKLCASASLQLRRAAAICGRGCHEPCVVRPCFAAAAHNCVMLQLFVAYHCHERCVVRLRLKAASNACGRGTVHDHNRSNEEFLKRHSLCYNVNPLINCVCEVVKK
ncbi:hypothetical protein L596_009769 [Steinernema carpocapsae]|uniref:Uncharacterized protein n=1 Tax=Steinernema carpocapsae TaxID=34508 RepID=A0A4U5PGJ1_STECR|nr:hypothetical protein L596_009769 [Steinernema carpocapsae]